MSVYPSVGRDWNHELAAFRRSAAPAKPFGGLPSPLWNHLVAETASLEASVGREHRKLLRLQLTVAHRVINWHEPAGLLGQKTSRETSDCTAICAGSALVIAIKQLASNGGNKNRFCTVRNHPMAAHFWKHQLAKTAIGWVE